MDKQKEILSLVKGKIDDLLNPSKSDYDPTLTEAHIFTSVNITEEQYYWALSISPDSDYELHLRRPINSCFINNYFIARVSRDLEQMLTCNLHSITTNALLMSAHTSQKMKLNVHRPLLMQQKQQRKKT